MVKFLFFWHLTINIFLNWKSSLSLLVSLLYAFTYIHEMKICYAKPTDGRRTGRYWRRMTPEEIAERDRKEARKKAAKKALKLAGITPAPPVNRTPKEAKNRCTFARKHKSWGEKWESVVWTQMTRIQNVRFWATMTYHGVGKLSHVNVEVKSSDSEKRIAEKQQLYMQTIKGDVLDTVEEHGLDPALCILQVNHNYANYSNVKEWLLKKEDQPFGEILVWPENSGDIDPVLSILDLVKERLGENYDTTVEHGTGEMWKRIQETWASIEPEEVKKEIEKTKQRLSIPLQKKGMRVYKSDLKLKR